jgi:uncharacterized protein
VRVFFDTNVLLSAYLRKGICFDLVNLVKAKNSSNTLVIGEAVLLEYEDKLKNRFKISESNLKFAITNLRELEVAPLPKISSPIPVRDSKDEIILATAIEAKVNILVTGDKDLLILGDTAGIKIVNPRTLWEMLTKEE